jgi:transcriptional regulator with XRE-family HTH domain
MPKLSEQLRAAIEKAGVSRYEISQATGVSQPSLSKFVLGQRPGLSFDAMDRIGEYLGLEIVKKHPKKKGATRGNSQH